ncbi:MAG TPA: hypothetical protein VN894_00820 [Polyangiaceae bacterium]|nr:hypothetical protein [Polyangiaceae bacterium]
MRCRSLLPLVVVLLGGCAHADTFEGGVLHKGELAVHFGPQPPGWRRVDVDGADLAFRDDAREGSTLFDVRCGHRDDDAPLSVLSDHLIMGTTEREIESRLTIPFDGREAMHTLLHAKLDGVPMQYDIYVMKKDGCVYDIVYVAPPAHFAEGAPDFERFTRGVHALSASMAVGSERTATPRSDP